MPSYISSASIGTAGGVLIAALAHPYDLTHAASNAIDRLDRSAYRANGEVGSGISLEAYSATLDSRSHNEYLATISGFYKNLLENQEMLGEEFEKAIFSNLSELYEE